MMTATFRRLLAGLVIGLVCVGCGSPSYGSARRDPGASSPSRGAFAWFAAQAPPRDWRLARIPAGAVLPYPPSWSPMRGDPGTATAALRTRRGAYLGYLNLTPRQGGETLSDWRAFRLAHNREEGDRDVKELAVADSLRFRMGQGNCVKDSYRGTTGNPYVEIACLIISARTSVVAVGAASPSAWPSHAAVIERAIEGVSG